MTVCTCRPHDGKYGGGTWTVSMAIRGYTAMPKRQDKKEHLTIEAPQGCRVAERIHFRPRTRAWSATGYPRAMLHLRGRPHPRLRSNGQAPKLQVSNSTDRSMHASRFRRANSRYASPSPSAFRKDGKKPAPSTKISHTHKKKHAPKTNSQPGNKQLSRGSRSSSTPRPTPSFRKLSRNTKRARLLDPCSNVVS